MHVCPHANGERRAANDDHIADSIALQVVEEDGTLDFGQSRPPFAKTSIEKRTNYVLKHINKQSILEETTAQDARIPAC